MKIKEAYGLKQVGEHFLVTRRDGERESILFALNETGALLWKGLSKGLSEEELTDVLCKEYEAQGDEVLLIQNDVREFLDQLKKVGALA